MAMVVASLKKVKNPYFIACRKKISEGKVQETGTNKIDQLIGIVLYTRDIPPQHKMYWNPKFPLSLLTEALKESVK